MTDLPEGVSRKLTRQRRRARLALLWESLWPRAWPVLGVLGLFLLAALSGLFLILPLWAHLLLLLGFVAALAWAARRAIRGFAAPAPAAADRRIESASGLRHRPLATLGDRPAGEDPAALALWQAHLARQAERLHDLRVGAPRPGLPARDRRALRLGLVVALAAGFVAAGDEAGERIRRAFLPSLGQPAPVPGLKLEAWVTPPGYTGVAPIFLQPGGPGFTAPAGSALRVALSGGQGGTPELRLGGKDRSFGALDRDSYGIEVPLENGGRLAIRRDGAELAGWEVSVQADAPPSIAFAEPPGPAPRSHALRLPWAAEDDWGVTAARAEIRLEARPGAEPLTVPLTLSGSNPRQQRGTAQPDLSAHPWAGLPVQIRLVARDGAGQEGHSEEVPVILPERPFNHPVAKLLIQFRRMLSLSPQLRGPVVAGLEGVLSSPEAFDDDTTVFLALSTARSRLIRDRRPEAVDETQAILWDTALALEEGRTDRTARALAEARKALEEALQQRDPNQSEAERRAGIEKRIQELRAAIDRHLQALAEKLSRENGEAMPREDARRLDSRDLDRRTQRMEEAARQGREEDARRELAEMEEMLKALEEGRVARADREQQRQQNRQRGQGQMSVMQDMVRRQAELLDRAHRREQDSEAGEGQDRPPGPMGQQNPANRPMPFGMQQRPGSRDPSARNQPGSQQDRNQAGHDGQQPTDAEAQRDGRTQRALRRALGELMQQFGDLTGEIPEPLGRADQAMRESAEALQSGRDSQAQQQQALRELTEGGRQMAQAMRRQFGQGQQGEGEGEGEEGDGPGMAGNQPGNGQDGGLGQDQASGQGRGRDPLGRSTRENAGSANDGNDTRVPDQAEMLRTRRIQEELRRRVGERERPAQELDYYDRLLRQF
ncbi:TIGR02302 family protein [Roseomonas gilardii subsp. gilardii]|uniref:TIGR02302 family protein n=1 Tax=Roseomonas gilardii TaxID=257708 RepID=UPI001FF9996F|nr:TIGR02302 family protein [Roseomonas gilardii]UPG73553.1 TIGR02302 family protein [Roseomonas gilardii subsp. gilardii]